MENNVPERIAIPPSEGVLTLCVRLWSGSSIRFFLMASLITEGMARYVNEKEVINASIKSYICELLTAQK